LSLTLTPILTYPAVSERAVRAWPRNRTRLKLKCPAQAKKTRFSAGYHNAPHIQYSTSITRKLLNPVVTQHG